MNYFIAAIKKYAVFQGRSSRSAFWYFILFQFLITALAAGIDAALGDHGVLYGLAVLAFLLPNLAVSIRRLHDTDRSGWWYAISLIPIAGLIALIVFWCQPGSPGENRFGSDPAADELLALQSAQRT
jgi:uncharacterized membrane protein YhaH (DUF805 family)